MNKINPLYIFAFFGFMAILMIFEGMKLEGKIAEQAQTNIQKQALGEKLQSLRQQWNDAQAAQKKIDAVLGLKQLADRVKTREKKADIYKVVVENLDAGEIDTLTAKLLNEAITVKTLSLTRNGDKNVTAAWEFAL